MTDSVSAHYLGVRGKIPQEHLDMLGRAWWTILEQCRREEIGNEVLPPLENSNLITTQAKRNLSSRSGIGGVLSAT